MANESPRRYWRSLEERAPDDAFREAAADEFPPAPEQTATLFGRRGFLQAAGFTLAGAVSAGCQRAPVRYALPFANEPETVTPGRSLWYASTCSACEAGCGVLVKVRDGRPIKIEGNPEHPLSRGGVCAAGQAAVLGLYDSQRFTGPRRGGADATWEQVDADVLARLAAIRASGGAVRVLSQTITSPALQAAIDRFLTGFADGRHVVYDALSASGVLDAHARTHGRRVLPRYALERASVLVGIDADFLGTWVSPVEFTRGYREARSLEGDPPRCSYHVQFEGRLSLTGTKADLRVRILPEDEPRVIEQLVARVAAKAGVAFEARGGAPAVDGAVLDDLAARLWAARGESLVMAGTPDLAAQVLVNYLNQLLGNYGHTIDLERPSRQRRGEDAAIERLAGELRAGSVAALVVLRANPVYELPAVHEFATLVPRAGLVVSLAQAPDETSALAAIVCPDHHALESWGDAEPVDGLAAVVQPAIRPLANTRAAIETFARWSGQDATALDLVRAHWQQAVFQRSGAGEGFDAFWDRVVHDGFTVLGAPSGQPAAFSDGAVTPLPASERQGDGFALVLHPTTALLDGRHAHNPWLQELPDPITKITWDNVAALAPAAAERLGVTSGDLVEIASPDGSGQPPLVLPVHVQPGQHEGVLAVALGYGRAGTERFADIGPRWLDAQPGVGPNGRVGVNLAPWLITRGGLVHASARRVTISRLPGRYELATTQHHHSINEPRSVSSAGARPLVVETSLSLLRSSADQELAPHPRYESWWPDDHPTGGPRWGMVVDLSACTGCSACVVACQAENNIPVVGRDEVRRQREMHWMRIDRYFTDAADDVDVVHQPMLCQHCANASCESVCPVLATVHSSEGLNEQVYNRCVGTRYCANNCAYKVRRFNWFNYAHPSERENLVLNPDVTVRTRGVMEKCSFCVQRIHEARTEARRRNVPLADGDVQPACGQSCPARAITFGDLNDPKSRVATLARSQRFFRVLEELDLRTSVGYLSVVRNREATSPEAHHG